VLHSGLPQSGALLVVVALVVVALLLLLLLVLLLVLLLALLLLRHRTAPRTFASDPALSSSASPAPSPG
jgi:hypothetical protein